MTVTGKELIEEIKYVLEKMPPAGECCVYVEAGGFLTGQVVYHSGGGPLVLRTSPQPTTGEG